jgi:hypothetical protein
MPITSQSNQPGWRRFVGSGNRTPRAYENIPTLRVQQTSAESNKRPNKMSPRRPAQFADPALFPGRRLDRRQPSSVVSGVSSMDHITLNCAAGKFRAALGSASEVGSTKASHVSLPAMGASSGVHQRPNADVHDP